MRKLVTFGVLLGFAFSVNAATDWYQASGFTRNIYVKFEQPVQSVAIHYVGKSFGRCTGVRANVKTMNFVPASTVSANKSMVAGLGLTYNRITGTYSATSAATATYTMPAVFSYNFTNALISDFHYNIVYTRGGKQYSLGWRPDSGGGCTYPL